MKRNPAGTPAAVVSMFVILYSDAGLADAIWDDILRYLPPGQAKQALLNMPRGKLDDLVARWRIEHG